MGWRLPFNLSRRFPSARCVVLEKEDGLGRHQTGHNNCVIHTGIYYRTGSLKAKNCVRGARLLKAFCDENGVEYEDCGKVIVATNPEEVPALEELYRRGTANGVSGLEVIGPERLREIEPHANGVKAIHSPETAIVDYNAVTDAYARLFRESGGEVWTGARVRGIGLGRKGLRSTPSAARFPPDTSSTAPGSTQTTSQRWRASRPTSDSSHSAVNSML